MLLTMFFIVTAAYNQNITHAEYFLDSDPGPGNGTPITISSPAEIVNFSASIPTNTLASGFHYLAVRVKDQNGSWGFMERRSFYIFPPPTVNTANITAAEYFIDSDPGPGNGIPIPVGTPGSTVNFVAAIPTSLSGGFHWIGIRVRDADGKWGFFESRSFYVNPVPVDMTAVTAAEYFFDTDPGVGNGTALTVNIPGNIVNQTFLIPVPASMSAGDHMLSIRVRDVNGIWGLFERDTITVSNAATIECPNDTTVNAATGQCSATVNGIDPVLAPPGTAFTYALAGATTGSGTGTASGLTFNAGVTTVTYALQASPEINCSFTVTVNTNVVPSVTIVASATTICSGTNVTFTATPVNGGTPTYQWKLNGVNVGSNSNTYQNANLVNGDAVSVIMTSSLGCATPQADTSNTITMSVSGTVTPSVSINASSTSICAGDNVTFTAIPVNGGSPTYQWKVNGVNVGTNSNEYQTTSLANGDAVTVQMTSSLGCAGTPTVVSSPVVMNVSAPVIASVSIAASNNVICSGTSVTFTANAINGGTPTYQWKVNNVNVGGNNSTYTSNNLANNDQVQVVMTSSIGCAFPGTVGSNIVTMNVTPTVTPSVSITSSSNVICSGTNVTFTATPVNGGTTPIYQWKVNGINVGSNSNTYQNANLANGDQVSVIMFTSLPCYTQWSDTSNAVVMSVSTSVAPSVSVVASATTICTGTNVTFTAIPVNGGMPTYQWKVNGNNVGGNSNVYQNTALANGDVVTVFMTSSLGCANPDTATSNPVAITVTPALTPSVSISANNIAVCSGTNVTFTATPVNGGTPTYQWRVNGINTGTNSNTYQSSGFSNGDVVTVLMTSSLGCTNPDTAVSNPVVMEVVSSITASVTISSNNTTICPGQTVTFTANPVNGGINPFYQWKLNGNNVGTNSSVFNIGSFTDGDVVTVELTSSLECVFPPTVTSNGMTVNYADSLPIYRDLDGDGYGNASGGSLVSCMDSAGYVTNNLDCDDQNILINPDATEICGNGIDENCNGLVDENCAPTELPVLIVRTYPVKEGDAGQYVHNLVVSLDKPALLPVTVNYATRSFEAIAGLDFVPAVGVLTIPAGSMSAIVQIGIKGDYLAEGNEDFWLNFSNPVNVTLGSDPRSRIKIIDNDRGKSHVSNTREFKNLPEESLKIPTVAKRNQVWMIPGIGKYENEITIVSLQGQVISRFVNYQNQTPLKNVAMGMYFYRIIVRQKGVEDKIYTGRLVITE